jgi:hypothetical protein
MGRARHYLISCGPQAVFFDSADVRLSPRACLALFRRFGVVAQSAGARLRITETVHFICILSDFQMESQ